MAKQRSRSSEKRAKGRPKNRENRAHVFPIWRQRTPILPASYLYDLDWLFLKTTQNMLHKYSVVSFACLLMLTYFLQPV